VLATSHCERVVEIRSVLIMETISSNFSLPSSRNTQDTAGREVWVALVIFPKALHRKKKKREKVTVDPEDSLVLKNSWVSWHIDHILFMQSP